MILHIGEWYLVNDPGDQPDDTEREGGEGPEYMVIITESFDGGWIGYEFMGKAWTSDWGPLGLCPLEYGAHEDLAGMLTPLEVH